MLSMGFEIFDKCFHVIPINHKRDDLKLFGFFRFCIPGSFSRNLQLQGCGGVFEDKLKSKI
jgi:hypothetical protein